MFNRALSYMSDGDLSDDWLSEDDCGVDPQERERIRSLPKRKKREMQLQRIDMELQNLTDNVDNVQMELEFRKSAGQEAANAHTVVVKEYEEKMRTLQWAMDKKLKCEGRRRSSLGTYVTTMRSVTGPGSMYVQAVQGEACRAVHMVTVQKRQRDLMNIGAANLVALLKKQMAEMEDEKAVLTKRALTRHFELSCEKRETAKNYERILKAQKVSIQELDKRLFNETLKTGLTASLAVKEASIQKIRRPARRASLSHSDSFAKRSMNAVRDRLNSSSDRLNFNGNAASMEEVEIEDSIEKVAEQPRRVRKKRASIGFMTISFGLKSTPTRVTKSSTATSSDGEDIERSGLNETGTESAGNGVLAASAMDLNSSRQSEKGLHYKGWEGSGKAATEVC